MDADDDLQSISERILSENGGEDDHDVDDDASLSSTATGNSGGNLKGGGGGAKKGDGKGDDQSTTASSNAQIADKENRYVLYIRLVVLFVLVASTVAVATVVYLYISHSETAEFKEQFESDAEKILTSLGDTFDLTLGALDAFVVNIVSYAAAEVAKASSSSAAAGTSSGNDGNDLVGWPFVTIPDFAVRAKKIQSLSNAVYMNVYPVVKNDASGQRDDWERYTSTHNSWVNESINIQAEDETFTGPINYTFATYDVVHDDWLNPLPYPGETNYTEAKSILLPIWQAYPVVSSTDGYPIYNWDVMSVLFNQSLVKTLDDQKVILSEAYHLPDLDDPDSVVETEISASWFSDYVDTSVQDPSEPISDLYYPIIDSANDHVQVYSEGETRVKKDGNIVGILAMSIYWRDTITNILPPGSDGLVVVFENECNPTFTFQINGPNAVYLGRGDLHDPTFDDMEISAWFNELSDLGGERSNIAYTGIPLDEEYCPFHMRVYPSKMMHQAYITNDATIFTIASILIFTFSTIVFVLYDYLVEQRQQKVYKTAVRSTAIVSSLFPSNVRDRLYVEQDQKQKERELEQAAGSNSVFRASNTATRFKSAILNGGAGGQDAFHSEMLTSPTTGRRYKTAAIADLFPEAVRSMNKLQYNLVGSSKS